MAASCAGSPARPQLQGPGELGGELAAALKRVVCKT